jgi:hypothetical protein
MDLGRHADIRGVILGKTCNEKKNITVIQILVLLQVLAARFWLE